jgi:hypothetical protein
MEPQSNDGRCAFKGDPSVRYFFNVMNSQTYRDDSGYFFASPQDAIDYAETIARELAKEPELRDSFVSVTDERAKEIARVPIRNP